MSPTARIATSDFAALELRGLSEYLQVEHVAKNASVLADGRRPGSHRRVDGLGIRAEQQLVLVAMGSDFDRCAADPEPHDDGVVAAPLDLAGAGRTLLIEAVGGHELAPLQAVGLKGQGVRLAIVGEAPTPARM
jgi:hypothetical protein